jgi:hypothetical protein
MYSAIALDLGMEEAGTQVKRKKKVLLFKFYGP